MRAEGNERIMKLSVIEKKRLRIYLLIAYGVTFLMGALMWYGYTAEKELSVFPNAQMFYPAAGVIVALLLTKKREAQIPKRFFISYLIVTGLMVACAIGNLLANQRLAVGIMQAVMMGGGIVCGILLLTEKKEVRDAYGLKGKNWKVSVFCILLFVGLYVLRVAIACGVSGQLGTLKDVAVNPMTWIMLVNIAINFFFIFPAFFGEEYGWRYYLQPLLQKRYGKRLGVLILGVVWGLWHLPVDFFYYTTPDSGLIAVAAQQITCITISIFFAYAYMKTENIWVPVIMHMLNNNLVPVLSGNYSADVLQNQVMTWGSLIPALVLNGLIFGGFLFAKEFRGKSH